jgi:hypothetical protein
MPTKRMTETQLKQRIREQEEEEEEDEEDEDERGKLRLPARFPVWVPRHLPSPGPRLARQNDVISAHGSDEVADEPFPCL